MLKRSLLLTLVVVALLSLSLVQADTNDRPDLCGELPQTDCQILVENEDSWMTLDSAGFAFSIDMDMVADESMQLVGEGVGAFEISGELMQFLIDANEDMTAVDMGALLTLMLTGVNGEITLEFSGDMDGEATDVALSLLMKDGVVLLDATALEAITGEPMGGVEALGIDLNEGLDEIFADVGVVDLSGVDDASEAEIAAISVTRLPDEEIRGDAVAVFESIISLETLFSMLSAEELVAATSSQEDPEEIAAMIEALEYSDLSMREYIGLDNRYTYLVDLSMEMQLSGDVGDSSIEIGMTVEMYDFNEPVDVEIPEDAFVFPLMMIMQMGSQ